MRAFVFRLVLWVVVILALLGTSIAVPGAANADGSDSDNIAVLGGRPDPAIPGAFVSLTPYRQLDTRTGRGGFSRPVPAWGTIRVKVTGQGGIPASGVSAVAVNVTVTNTGQAGNITVYAGGTAQPGTSNLNFNTGQTVPNFVISPIGSDGTVALTNNSNSNVDLIADSSGYYLGGSVTNPGAFSSQTPFRQLDTRYNNAIAPWATMRVKVTGRGGIPVSGVLAVAVNVTVTNPGTAGNITVYAGGTSQPGTSNLNFVAGQTVPNFVQSPVGADGTIALTNNSNSTVHLLADTAGYYLAGTAAEAGAFAARTPFRQLDTRYNSTVEAHRTIRVKVTGRGGIPAVGVAAMALNVTVTSPESAGNITVYPGGTTAPATSNLNFVRGQTVPNLVNTLVGSDGTILLTNNSHFPVHLIADSAGYFVAGTPIDAVYAWGRNTYGELGNGTTTAHDYPTKVKGLAGVASVTGTGTKLARLKDGTVWGWGYNTTGVLGNGTVTHSSLPVQAKGLTNVKQVAIDVANAYAVRNDGTVWAWGQNQYGQLGDGTSTGPDSPTTRSIPAEVPGLAGVQSIAVGGSSVHALMNDGTVKAWGVRLGSGYYPHPTPMEIPGLTGVQEISTEGGNAYAFLTDGRVMGWGGRPLGNGSSQGSSSPAEIPELFGARKISDGRCALMGDGTVRTWGWNGTGRLGDGTTTESMLPVEPIGVKNAKDITCNRNNSFVVLNDGTVRAWGYHAGILLGTGGDETDVAVPTPVLELTDVKEVKSTAGVSTFALLNDGSVRGWGANPGGSYVDYAYSLDRSPGPATVAYITGISDLQD